MYIPTSDDDKCIWIFKKCCLFYIHDLCYTYEFLTPVLYKLQAANGTKVDTYNKKSFNTRSRLHHTFHPISEYGYQNTNPN